MSQNRHSISVTVNQQSKGIEALKAKIRCLEQKGDDRSDYDPNSFGVEISTEQVLIQKKTYIVRRAYLINHKYRIGWVVDADLTLCMICAKEFGLFQARLKHHCRTCGALVCRDCSHNFIDLSSLINEKKARTCGNCFGIKPGILTPIYKSTGIDYSGEGITGRSYSTNSSPSTTITTNSGVNSVSQNTKVINNKPPNVNLWSTTPTNSSKYSAQNKAALSNAASTTAQIVRNTGRSSGTSPIRRDTNNNRSPINGEDLNLQKYYEEIEAYEMAQKPKYEEAYSMMREFIPLDIYKMDLKKLIQRGLPEEIAHRIWDIKILWLICTHPDDIAKIHLADFRSKYHYNDLDIIELRAIWYILPSWDMTSTNPLVKGKAEWKDGFKSKLDDYTYKEANNTLSIRILRHPVYEAYSMLHLFDPQVPLVPRFHRSASYTQDAIESPIQDHYQAVDDSFLYESPIVAYGESDGIASYPEDYHNTLSKSSQKRLENLRARRKVPANTRSVKDRSEQYLQECETINYPVTPVNKYKTLLEEINASSASMSYDDMQEVDNEDIDDDDDEDGFLHHANGDEEEEEEEQEDDDDVDEEGEEEESEVVTESHRGSIDDQMMESSPANRSGRRIPANYRTANGSRNVTRSQSQQQQQSGVYRVERPSSGRYANGFYASSRSVDDDEISSLGNGDESLDEQQQHHPPQVNSRHSVNALVSTTQTSSGRYSAGPYRATATTATTTNIRTPPPNSRAPISPTPLSSSLPTNNNASGMLYEQGIFPPPRLNVAHLPQPPPQQQRYGGYGNEPNTSTASGGGDTPMSQRSNHSGSRYLGREISPVSTTSTSLSITPTSAAARHINTDHNATFSPSSYTSSTGGNRRYHPTQGTGNITPTSTTSSTTTLTPPHQQQQQQRQSSSSRIPLKPLETSKYLSKSLSRSQDESQSTVVGGYSTTTTPTTTTNNTINTVNRYSGKYNNLPSPLGSSHQTPSYVIQQHNNTSIMSLEAPFTTDTASSSIPPDSANKHYYYEHVLSKPEEDVITPTSLSNSITRQQRHDMFTSVDSINMSQFTPLVGNNSIISGGGSSGGRVGGTGETSSSKRRIVPSTTISPTTANTMTNGSNGGTATLFGVNTHEDDPVDMKPMTSAATSSTRHKNKNTNMTSSSSPTKRNINSGNNTINNNANSPASSTSTTVTNSNTLNTKTKSIKPFANNTNKPTVVSSSSPSTKHFFPHIPTKEEIQEVIENYLIQGQLNDLVHYLPTTVPAGQQQQQEDLSPLSIFQLYYTHQELILLFFQLVDRYFLASSDDNQSTSTTSTANSRTKKNGLKIGKNVNNTSSTSPLAGVLIDSLYYLLDYQIVDINTSHPNPSYTKQTLLHLAIAYQDESLGRALINRGANVFQLDVSPVKPQCPLSYSLQVLPRPTDYSTEKPFINWVIDEFEISGFEDDFLFNDEGISSSLRLQYVSYFVLEGYATKAKELLAHIPITTAIATEWLQVCTSNGRFDTMVDAIGTYELLESLGAV